MCDTLVALGNSTEDGSVIIAKNSDREPNECQVLRCFPRTRYPARSTVRCTYIEIPQVTETYEVVLSAPYWMWGAEMGANEHGVAIGNESAWSKEPYAKTGLLGMDLIRLALERADTARNALNVITSLLKEFGQGGNTKAVEPEHYHNTFMIADPREAWVLETADHFWVAEKVRDVRSISNGYTIESQWDLASPGLVDHAIEHGWCKSKKDFSFANCYSDQAMRDFIACVERAKKTSTALKEAKGSVNVETMMKILRDHGEKAESWSPPKAKNVNTCWHSTTTVVSSTAGSYVGHLTEKVATHWLTGTSYPCISVFFPVYLKGAGSPELYSKGGNTYDDGSPWWRHEKLARIIQLNYINRAPPIKREISKLQRNFIGEANRARQQALELPELDAAKLLRRLSDRCSQQVYETTTVWTNDAKKTGSDEVLPISYKNYWNRMNAKANLQI
nr:C69 family dipeptidase [Candidatus Njordarchaeum guaymaensis]